jgi:hypothetical protein
MVGGSLRVLRLLPTTKTGHHNIAEILLKVALNTINQIKSTKEAIKNRLSRNSGNIGLKTRNEDKQYKKTRNITK